MRKIKSIQTHSFSIITLKLLFQHIIYNNFILNMTNINAWTVLTTSPHELVGE